MEHHAKTCRILKRKLQIGTCRQTQALGGILIAAQCQLHALVELMKSFGGEGSEDIFFLLEMSVRGVVRNTGTSGHFAKREGAESDLADKL